MQEPKTKALMSTKLITTTVGTPLSEAYRLMEQKRIRHLPVLNGSDEIIGILSQRDLGFIKNQENIPVEYAMSAPVVHVDQNAPLRSAIFKMLELKISSLLIADQESNVLGIITTDDLLWYLSSLLEDPKENNFSLSSLFDLRTVGEAARMLSNAGV
jgi:CBS domain-containing protein